MRRRKGKKKLKLAAAGLFAAAEADAIAEEQSIAREREQLVEQELKRKQQEPKLLPKDNELAQATAEARNKTRYGRPVIQNRQAVTPIVRVGRKPGIGGHSIPAFLKPDTSFNAVSDSSGGSVAKSSQSSTLGVSQLKVRKSRLKLEQEAKAAKQKRNEEEAQKMLAGFAESFNPTPIAHKRQSSETSSNPAKKKRTALDTMLLEMKKRHDGKDIKATKQDIDTASEMLTEDEKNISTQVHVRNLIQSVTEADLFDEFSKFGSLVSLKIICSEVGIQENKSKSHSAYVAYNQRRSAEQAIERLQNFNLCGAKLRLDWTKPLKNAATLETLSKDSLNSSVQQTSTQMQVKTRIRFTPSKIFRDPVAPEGKCIKIEKPSWTDKKWLVILINKTAEYVAQDGYSFEDILKRRERNNSEYAWLFDNGPENLYYRWRVVAFLMGDDRMTWNRQPFRFYASDDVWYIPPDYPSEAELRYYSMAKEAEAIRRLNEESQTSKAGSFLTGAAKERERYSARLRKRDKNKLKKLLEKMTLERDSVLKVMGFCLDYAECAIDCSSILLGSLIGEEAAEAPPLLIVARFYALSDVLHNSNAPVKNASAYRTHLQPKLPEVFEMLSDMHRSSGGRFSAEQIKSRVLKVLEAWRSWMLLSPRFVLGLETTFLPERTLEEKECDDAMESLKQLSSGDLKSLCAQSGIAFEGQEKANVLKKLVIVEVLSKRKEAEKLQHQIKNQRKEEPEGSDRKQRMDTSSLSKMVAENLRDVQTHKKNKLEQKKDGGTDSDSDIDGEPMDSDVDGEPLSSDIDGEPLSSDIDGDPLNE